MLTGSTVKRDAVVSAFTADARASVFRVSLRAGGTGLNLTAASAGINVGLAWAYVAARVVHSPVQATKNKIMVRFTVFAIGSLVLFLLLLRTAWMVA